MKGLNHVFVGGETYVDWTPRGAPLGAEWMWVKDEVEEADETDEEEEKTESLSESELPEEVDC